MTRRLLLLCGFCLALAPAAGAQTTWSEGQPAPPHLSVVDGDVAVEREAHTDEAVSNLVLVPGDRVRSSRGRAEILLDDGSAIHVDESTALDFLDESRFRLLEGRIAVVAGDRQAGRLQIDTPAGVIRARTFGEARVLVTPGGVETEVAVIRGLFDVATDRGSLQVRAGESTLVRDGESPYPVRPFNSARWDDFDRWSQAQLAARRGTVAASYLPSDLRAYSGVLDQYGAWGYQAPYGQVWYPTVAVGWKPYLHGHWRHRGRFGWVWVGSDRWAWPTHHYGRWGLSPAGLWFWIPARTWAPAWVHWAVSPGYFSWCPLGFDNRPVIAFAGHGRYAYPSRWHDPWRAWTVVRSDSFGRHVRLAGHAVDGRHLPRSAPFVVQAAPPNVAVPRGVVAARPAPAASVAPATGRSRVPGAGPGRDDGVSVREAPSRRSPAEAYGRAGVAVPRAGAAAADERDRGSSAPAEAGRSRRSWTPPPVHYGITQLPQPAPSDRGDVAVPRRGPGDATSRPSRDGSPSYAPPPSSDRPTYGVRPSPREVAPARPASPPDGGAAPRSAPSRPVAPAGPPARYAPRSGSPSPGGAVAAPRSNPSRTVAPAGPPARYAPPPRGGDRPSAAPPPARQAPQGSSGVRAVPRDPGSRGDQSPPRRRPRD